MTIMTKRLSLILVVALVALASQAQLLWKVSGGNLARPSYIFGTHHMAPKTMIDQVHGLDDAIQACDIVVGEVARDSLLSNEVQGMMAGYMMAPADSTLSKLYTDEEYKIVATVFNKYFGSMGVRLNQMENLKPVAVSTQMQAIQMMKYFPEFNGADGMIDMAVLTRANEAGRPSEGLETVKEQCEILFNGSLKDQAHSLLESCKKDEYFEQQCKELNEAYLSQNLDKVWAAMNNATSGDSEAELESLIYSRNRSWATKLQRMMPERACLVCVGCGHLPGDQGLLQLLRNAGYTVTPVQ